MSLVSPDGRLCSDVLFPPVDVLVHDELMLIFIFKISTSSFCCWYAFLGLSLWGEKGFMSSQTCCIFCHHILAVLFRLSMVCSYLWNFVSGDFPSPMIDDKYAKTSI